MPTTPIQIPTICRAKSFSRSKITLKTVDSTTTPPLNDGKKTTPAKAPDRNMFIRLYAQLRSPEVSATSANVSFSPLDTSRDMHENPFVANERMV